MNFASFTASSTTSAIITYSYDRMAELPQTLNTLQRTRHFVASVRLTSPALFPPPSADNATYYYQIDGNKNVTELTDASGAVVAHYEYSPFGAVVTATGTYAEDNPFRFSSEYYAPETGLVYYNYRYDSPTLGRWLNPDPIEEYGGWNLYAMVKNNIIDNFDWLGLVVGALPPMLASSTSTMPTSTVGSMIGSTTSGGAISSTVSTTAASVASTASAIASSSISRPIPVNLPHTVEAKPTSKEKKNDIPSWS